MDCRSVSGARLGVDAMGPTWTLVDAAQAHKAGVRVAAPRETTLKAGFAAKIV